MAGLTSVRPKAAPGSLVLGAAAISGTSILLMPPVATICLDCGDVVHGARYGRCPRCSAVYLAAKNNKRTKADDKKRTKAGEQVRREHGAIVRTARWRRTAEQVKRRDGYQCARCGTSEKLQVHHTNPARYADNPYDADDLVTLCASCHGIVEAARRRLLKGGRSNIEGGRDPNGGASFSTRGGSAGEVSNDTDWIS